MYAICLYAVWEVECFHQQDFVLYQARLHGVRLDVEGCTGTSSDSASLDWPRLTWVCLSIRLSAVQYARPHSGKWDISTMPEGSCFKSLQISAKDKLIRIWSKINMSSSSFCSHKQDSSIMPERNWISSDNSVEVMKRCTNWQQCEMTITERQFFL